VQKSNWGNWGRSFNMSENIVTEGKKAGCQEVRQKKNPEVENKVSF